MDVIKAIKEAPSIEEARIILSNTDLERIAKKLNIFYPTNISKASLSSIIIHICRKYE